MIQSSKSIDAEIPNCSNALHNFRSIDGWMGKSEGRGGISGFQVPSLGGVSGPRLDFSVCNTARNPKNTDQMDLRFF